MKRAIALAGGTLLVLALAGPAGRAATTINVEVRNFEMVPRGVAAAAGDTIRFTITSGNHRLAAFEGDTFDTGVVAAGMTVDQSFVGGTVKYRCTVPGHSTLSGSVCDGMCGVISDTAPAVPAPSITTPTDGAVIDAPGTNIGGFATGPAKIVRLFDNGGRLADVTVSGGSFSRGVSLTNGTHRLTAISIHADGYQSPPSQAVTITIQAPDTEPPRIELSKPSQGATTRPLDIAGLARDDGLVTQVGIVVTNLATGEVQTPPVICHTCGTGNASFSARAGGLPGLYQVDVTATDATGKVGSASRTVVAI